MRAVSEHEGFGELAMLTDPWALAPNTRSPAMWWRPPASVALGTAGVLLASGSLRQQALVLVVAAIVAGVLFIRLRPSVATASLRVGILALTAVVARPHIGGRQLVLTVVAVGLSSLALGARPGRSDESSTRPVVGLAVAPLVAAQVVVVRDGSELVLAGLLTLGAAATAIGLIRPGALARADHGLAAIVRTLVGVVAAVILFPVALVCLYLPGAVVRVVGAARTRSRPGPVPTWLPYGIGLRDEQTDSGRPFASTPRPVRVRRHLTGVALVTAVALLAGIVVVRARHSPAPAVPEGLTLTRVGGTPGTTAPPGSTPSRAKTPFAAEFAAPYSSLPPYRDVAWADELQKQEGNDPEIHERWVNVTDSVRQSLPPPRCACKKLEVWFAGGSAAFGYGQRDSHTIASDLVRIGTESGISIDISNLGRAGATLAVEVQQIRDRLAKEAPPDLIIFFDGFNDGLFLTAFNFGDSRGTDDRANLDGLGALDYITAHPDAYLESDVGPAAAAEAVGHYRDLKREMDALARSKGIATAWFFQPDAFVSRIQLDGYDRVTNISPDEFMGSPLAVALRIMAEELAGDGVTNLRPVFERYPRPVFLGVVHQSEEGAALTAQAIYDHLAGRIEELAS